MRFHFIFDLFSCKNSVWPEALISFIQLLILEQVCQDLLMLEVHYCHIIMYLTCFRCQEMHVNKTKETLTH